MEKSFKNFKIDEGKWTDYGTEEVSFDKMKDSLELKIKNLLSVYDNFTKNVSPKHWRTTGHHYTELKKILGEINNFTEISEKEKMKSKNI